MASPIKLRNRTRKQIVPQPGLEAGQRCCRSRMWINLATTHRPRNTRSLNNSRVDRRNSPGDHSEIVGARCHLDNTAHRVDRCRRRGHRLRDIGHLHTHTGLAAQPDIEGVSRRSDNSGHGYQYRSHVRSTELGSISHSGSGRLSQGERRLLRLRV
jgi:hypothetical protein